MQAHIKQRELNLAQGLQPALEVFGGQHFVEERAWQGLAGVYMRGHVAQHAPFPAKVFHELAGQLHRVPFNAADTGDVALVDLREHVVQPVAAFVEEGDHVVMRQQRRLAAHALGKVAHQMRHRGLQCRAVRAQPAGAHIVHPGTAALACARAGVQIELTQQHACALDAVELHRRVPHRRAVAADAHLKKGFHNLEQAGQHLRRGEVVFDLLLAEGIARLFELFTDKGPVPGLRVGQVQMLGREGAHLSHVFVGKGAGAGGQVAQKAGDFFTGLRHLGGQRHGCEVRITQQLRFFLAQGQDFLHQRAIVLGGVGGLVRGAGDIGAVDLLAQRAAVRKLHDRQIAGHLQAEFVASCAIGLGGGAGRVEHVLGNASECFCAHQQ